MLQCWGPFRLLLWSLYNLWLICILREEMWPKHCDTSLQINLGLRVNEHSGVKVICNTRNYSVLAGPLCVSLMQFRSFGNCMVLINREVFFSFWILHKLCLYHHCYRVTVECICKYLYPLAPISQWCLLHELKWLSPCGLFCYPRINW